MQAEYLNRRKKHMEQVAASSTGIFGIRKRGIYMRNMTFGGFLAGLCTIIGLLCFIGAVSDAAEPKCIVTGCSNKRAPESSYCYLHKPYRRSYTSSYSSGSSGSSSSSSYGKSSGSSSSGSSSYKSSSTSGSSRKVLMEPAATEKAQRIPTMTDMMTSIWTGITTMTVMPETATTRMASMMRWMSWGMIRKTAEKIANHVWRYEITDGI